MDVIETQARLIRLQAERHSATELGVANPSPYMTRLDRAIDEARAAYVTSAVLEIAVRRGGRAGVARG